MLTGLLGKIGLSFATDALKKNAGPIILFLVVTGGFAFAGWKYHSLYVMAMDTKVELTEVRGELDRALAEKAQYLSTIDKQNEGLADLKKRTSELKAQIDDSKKKADEFRRRYDDIISGVKSTEIKDKSCDGVMHWMATEAKEAAKW